jgi:hypothetical protein
MEHKRHLSRRTFLQQAGLSGIALTIGCYWPASGKSTGEIAPVEDAEAIATELMAWISIDTAGNVTLFNHRSEMGQGTWQAIPQIVAEELEVAMDNVRIQYAPANPKKYGPQPQEGSFSIRGWYQQLLRMGASARGMLIEAAARQWRVAATECYAENGHVVHRATGRKLNYGVLVKDAAQLTPPQPVKLKERKDYKIIGKPIRRKDIAAKTNGTAVFGLDKKLPGMLYAVVERSPRFRGKVKSFDDAATRSVSGVKHVMKVQRAVFGLMYEGVAAELFNLAMVEVANVLRPASEGILVTLSLTKRLTKLRSSRKSRTLFTFSFLAASLVSDDFSASSSQEERNNVATRTNGIKSELIVFVFIFILSFCVFQYDYRHPVIYPKRFLKFFLKSRFWWK